MIIINIPELKIVLLFCNYPNMFEAYEEYSKTFNTNDAIDYDGENAYKIGIKYDVEPDLLFILHEYLKGHPNRISYFNFMYEESKKEDGIKNLQQLNEELELELVKKVKDAEEKGETTIEIPIVLLKRMQSVRWEE